jgi:hypothetical protein
MNILRQPPFPIQLPYEDLTADETYILEIYNDHSELIVSEQVTASDLGMVSYTLPRYFEKYDGTYSLYIYSMDIDEVADETVVIDNLYIYRPYVNPITLSDDECDIEEYAVLERTARHIIDTIVGGFYYESKSEEAIGLGTDVLPLRKRANKINAVYQNNVKVYDKNDPVDGQYSYIITPDSTALTIQIVGEYNRAQSKTVRMPVGASDSFMLYGDNYDQVLSLTEINGAPLFPKDWDYIVSGEWGWPVVPQDIKDATRLLIDDIKCGRLSYISKYITEYQTDQFKIKYSDMSLTGSGNLAVDRILERYSTPIYRLGVI